MDLACSMAACREDCNDGKEWSFYFLNGGERAIAHIELERVASDWGARSTSIAANVRFEGIQPRAHVLVWRGSADEAEFRQTLHVRVTRETTSVSAAFEFPKLYRLGALPVVAGLGRAGLQVTCDGYILG